MINNANNKPSHNNKQATPDLYWGEYDLSKPRTMVALIREPFEGEPNQVPSGQLFMAACLHGAEALEKRLRQIAVERNALGVKSEVLVFTATYGVG